MTSYERRGRLVGTSGAALATLLLAMAVEARPRSHYRVEPNGRIFAGQLGLAEVPAARVTIVATIEGDVDAATWCQWARVEWPDGTISGQESDCPPWEDWLRERRDAEACRDQLVVASDGSDAEAAACAEPYAPQRRWTWTRWFAAGDYAIPVTFLDGRRVVRRALARFLIPGADDRTGFDR